MLIAQCPPPRSKHLPPDPLCVGVLPLVRAQSRSLLCSASSHIRDHNASPSPVRIALVKCCPHVWHSHHTFTPRCDCCDIAFSIRQSTCARPLSDRHAQPDWIGSGWESRQMVQTRSASVDEDIGPEGEGARQKRVAFFQPFFPVIFLIWVLFCNAHITCGGAIATGTFTSSRSNVGTNTATSFCVATGSDTGTSFCSELGDD